MNGNENGHKKDKDIILAKLKKLKKEDLLEILKHDDFVHAVDEFSRLNGWVQVLKIIAFVLTSLLAFGGFYLAWHATYEENKAAQLRSYEERQAQYLDNQIKEKITWMRKGVNVVMDMRKTRYLIVLRCEYNNPMNAGEQARERFIVRDQVARTYTGFRYVFNNNVEDVFRKLNQFDESVQDVCAKDAPPDDEWRKYLLEAVRLMGQSIQEDQTKLENLK